MTPRIIFLSFFVLMISACAGNQPRQEFSRGEVQSLSENTVSPPSNPTQEDQKATAEYHFSLAQAYVAEGNPDRAIEEYKATLMFDPNSALVYARLATEYVKKGMLSAAMESCKEALKRDASFTDARLMLAGLYSTSREMDSALVEYDRVLKSDPTNEEAAVYKAQVLIEDSRPIEAAKSLNVFLKNNSSSALGWYYLGRAEQQQDHFKEAVVAFKKALEANDGFSQAALALAYTYESKGMTEQAVAAYKELFDSSRDVTAANRLSTLYLKEGKYKEALPYLESMLQTDPDDMNVRVKYGLIQMEMKNYETAINSFNQILEKNPDSDRVNFYLANIYEEQKKYSASVDRFRKILPDSRFFEEANLHAAFLLKLDGKSDEAKNQISSAISRSPKVAGFYLFQASLEDEAKNTPEAIAILEKALTQFPDHERIRYYLGSLYDRQGNTSKGLLHMEAIVQSNPDHADALNYIGYTWTSQGVRLDDAEKLLRKAMGINPDNGYIRDSWGYYLFTRGRVSEAVAQLEKAAVLKPQEPVILEHLGDAYLRANLRQKALQQYQEAIKSSDGEMRAKLQEKVNHLLSDFAGKSKDAEGQKRSPASAPTH